VKFPKSPYLVFGFYRQDMLPLILVSELLKRLASKGVRAVNGQGTGYEDVGFGELTHALQWLDSLDPDTAVEVELAVRGGGAQLLGNHVPSHGITKNPESTPVVHLFMSGATFSGNVSSSAEAEGLSAFNRFIWLCTEVCPTYASITVEWELESPQELIQDPQSYGFQDFYLGADLGMSVLERSESIFEGAFVRRLEAGIYISSHKWFNPKRIQIHESEKRSCEIGRLLASHFRSAQFGIGS